MIFLDAIDRRILERLQQDGRLSNADLAEKVGLSSSPCWRRVRALEEAGVIKGYAALLDAKQVGLSVNVFMSVSLSTQNEKSLKEFERAAAARPEVMECYLMTGDSDYLIRVVVPDVPALERFKPEMLFVSAGFDAHRDDDLAMMKLVEADYTWVTQQLRAVAERHCNGRIVSLLEGGYNLHALGRSATAHIKVLAGL